MLLKYLSGPFFWTSKTKYCYEDTSIQHSFSRIFLVLVKFVVTHGFITLEQITNVQG